MKRILLIGASGFIGRYCYKKIKSNLGDHELTGTFFKNLFPELINLDYTNLYSLNQVLKTIRPDIIIWTAGIKDLSLTEQKNYSLKEQNEIPISEILTYQNRINKVTQLVFISSDYVFNGIKGNYETTDDPCPNTNYGKSKYNAEKIIINNNKLYSIIRAGAVIGRGSKFFEWIKDELKMNKSIELFDDIFSPTPINNIADAIIFSIKNKLKGIYHISGGKDLSRYEFGMILKKYVPNSNSKLIKLKNINFSLENQINRSLVRSKEFDEQESLNEFLKNEFLK